MSAKKPSQVPKQKGRQVRLSEEVYDEIAKNAKPFERLDVTLRRMLGLSVRK